jgi:hypothetical protein
LDKVKSRVKEEGTNPKRDIDKVENFCNEAK